MAKTYVFMTSDESVFKQECDDDASAKTFALNFSNGGHVVRIENEDGALIWARLSDDAGTGHA